MEFLWCAVDLLPFLWFYLACHFAHIVLKAKRYDSFNHLICRRKCLALKVCLESWKKPKNALDDNPINEILWRTFLPWKNGHFFDVLIAFLGYHLICSIGWLVDCWWPQTHIHFLYLKILSLDSVACIFFSFTSFFLCFCFETSINMKIGITMHIVDCLAFSLSTNPSANLFKVIFINNNWRSHIYLNEKINVVWLTMRCDAVRSCMMLFCCCCWFRCIEHWRCVRMYKNSPLQYAHLSPLSHFSLTLARTWNARKLCASVVDTFYNAFKNYECVISQLDTKTVEIHFFPHSLAIFFLSSSSFSFVFYHRQIFGQKKITLRARERKKRRIHHHKQHLLQQICWARLQMMLGGYWFNETDDKINNAIWILFPFLYLSHTFKVINFYQIIYLDIFLKKIKIILNKVHIHHATFIAIDSCGSLKKALNSMRKWRVFTEILEIRKFRNTYQYVCLTKLKPPIGCYANYANHQIRKGTKKCAFHFSKSANSKRE